MVVLAPVLLLAASLTSAGACCPRRAAALRFAPHPAHHRWAPRADFPPITPPLSRLSRPRPHAVYDIMGSGAALMRNRPGDGGARC